MKKFLYVIVPLFCCTLRVRSAEIGVVYPAGAQRGTQLDVSVRGQGLRQVNGAHISGDGVQVTLKQVIPFDPAVPNKRRKIPALQDEVIVHVSIAPDAQPGPRDFRVVFSNDVSATPLVFHVGTLPECKETQVRHSLTYAMPVPTLPICINGVVEEQEADYYRFHATAGQTLVAQMQGRSLIPYLADAVPGWFQPIVTVFTRDGKVCASADDRWFDPDPILIFKVPATDDYVIQVRDAIWRGRDDFVYRLTLGALPLVTSFFPMGGRIGVPTTVVCAGANLTSNTFVVDPADATAFLPVDTLRFPALRFDSDTLPEQVEREPNNTIRSAQKICFPVILNGTIASPGDRDHMTFKGTAGQTLVAEVRARSLGSPLDAQLQLYDGTGQLIAEHDDTTNALTGLLTHQADAYLSTTLPKNDTYCLVISDTANNGQPEAHYRLRISEPRPDFELWMKPSSAIVPINGSYPLELLINRKDGFKEPIRLELVDAPSGVSLSGGVINSRSSRATIPLVADRTRKVSKAETFKFRAHATVNGTDITHDVIPAHPKLQAFYYTHLVPDNTFFCQLRYTAGSRVALRAILPESEPWVKASRTRPFTLDLEGYGKFVRDEMEVTVIEPEEGFSVVSTEANDQHRLHITLSCANADYLPATSGNLIIQIGKRNPKNQGKRMVVLSPAIPYILTD